MGLGLKVTMDNRTNVYYPRSGFLSNIQFFTYPEFMGNDFESKKIEISHNHFSLIERDMMLLQQESMLDWDLAIFHSISNLLLDVGMTFRGYTQGEYRGNYMTAVQGEYRWNLNEM